MTTPSEYFERRRGYWNFVASLVVGIVAGSLLSVTIERIFSITLQSPYDVYIPFAIAPTFAVVLVYVAIRFSAGLETTTKVYQLVVGADSFSSVVRPALIQLQRSNQSQAKELQEKLGSVISVMGSKDGLRAANLQALRIFRADLVKMKNVWSNKDVIVAGMLSKLIAMLGTLELVPGEVPKVCEEKSKVVFKGVPFRIKISTEKKFDRITARKGRFLWSRVIFRLDFFSNIDSSLLTPANCTVTTYPLADFMEHRKFESNIEYLLGEVKSKKEFQELGMEFLEIEKAEYWTSMKETVADPILRHLQLTEERIIGE